MIHGGPGTGRTLVEAPWDGVAFHRLRRGGSRAIAQRMQEGPYARPALTEMAVRTRRSSPQRRIRQGRGGRGPRRLRVSGQKCSARSRAIVIGSVHDEFVERLAAFSAGPVPGDPADSDVFLGPVVNEDSVARFEAAAADARLDGVVAAGGARPDLPGPFVETHGGQRATAGAQAQRDELFLPFVTVSSVNSLDEAIAEANAPVYGLTAGIFSERQRRAERFLDTIEAGVVYVNRRAGDRPAHCPALRPSAAGSRAAPPERAGSGPYYLPHSCASRAGRGHVSSSASSAYTRR